MGRGLGGPSLREKALQRAIRVHGNFIETAPWGLLLLLLMEQTHAMPRNGLYAFGAILCIARLMHAFGLSRYAGPSIGRTGGMIVTALLYLTGAVFCLKVGLGY